MYKKLMLFMIMALVVLFMANTTQASSTYLTSKTEAEIASSLQTAQVRMAQWEPDKFEMKFLTMVCLLNTRRQALSISDNGAILGEDWTKEVLMPKPIVVGIMSRGFLRTAFGNDRAHINIIRLLVKRATTTAPMIL